MKTIGIDLGGHTIACAEIDISHREPYILRRIEMQTPEERTLPEVLSALIGGISQLACDERELNIGIGVPGFLDKERKKIQKPSSKRPCADQVLTEEKKFSKPS